MAQVVPYGGADALDHETEAALAAVEAERTRRALEAENRALRAELLAVKGAVRTSLRLLARFYVDE